VAVAELRPEVKGARCSLDSRCGQGRRTAREAQRRPQLPPPLGFDREVATDGLRKALQQGLLTEDEHGARAAQAPAARSRAELAALTAGLPAGLTTRLPRASDVWTGVKADAGES
jgi:hypothetical protein